MTTTFDLPSQHAPPAPVELSRPAELLLVRLLASASAKRAPTPVALTKDLNALLPQPVSAEGLHRLLRELADSDLAELKPLRLTDRGRAQALVMLGLEALPPKSTWKTLLHQHVFPVAAGVPTTDCETRHKLKTAGYLKGYLIRQRYALDAGPVTPMAKLLEALACKELGFPEITDLKSLQAAVLSRLVGSAQALKPKELEKQLPRVAMGTTSDTPDELRKAVLRKWLAGEENAAPEPAQTTTSPHPVIANAASYARPLDLPAFASAAVAAARRTPPAGWFGDNKVFISHAWQTFRQQPGGQNVDLPAFKQRLVEANREGLLRLSRADLVSAMDPADVRASETRYLNAEFHFILIERATEGAPR